MCFVAESCALMCPCLCPGFSVSAAGYEIGAGPIAWYYPQGTQDESSEQCQTAPNCTMKFLGYNNAVPFTKDPKPQGAMEVLADPGPFALGGILRSGDTLGRPHVRPTENRVGVLPRWTR